MIGSWRCSGREGEGNGKGAGYRVSFLTEEGGRRNHCGLKGRQFIDSQDISEMVVCKDEASSNELPGLCTPTIAIHIQVHCRLQV
jgi:hypothetical protein